MKAKITVVTVCYNCVQDIERTILSVVNQTYTNIEYIIIDGGSKDGTLDVINNYRDKITRIISEPDNGIYDAMNKGTRYATGEWINFMNVGDVFHSDDTIEKVFDKFQDNGEAIVYGKTKVIDRQLNKIIFIGFGHNDFMPSHHQAIFTRTSEMKAHPFILKYKIAADGEFFYSLYRKNKKQYKVEEIIVDYDDNGVSSVQTSILEHDYLMIYLKYFDISKIIDWTIAKFRHRFFSK